MAKLPKLSKPPKLKAAKDVRALALSAATRLFAARGFDGTALQDIADAVGVRKPSLLYYFPSKDDLRKAVLDEMLSHWNDVLPRVLLAASSGEDQFDGVLREMISFFRAEPDRARLLIREVLDRPREMGRLTKKHVGPWVEVVVRYIQKGQAQGRVREDVDPFAYVHQVINLLVASVASQHALGAPDAERNTTELLRIAKQSLFREPPAR